jgi:peptide/nickel transport system permease protein
LKLLNRFFLLLFLLLAVATAVFFLLHIIPGDPAAGILGEGANSMDLQRMRSRLNLDKPLIHQYLDFLGNLVNFSFGKSLFDGRSVMASILSVLPNTIYLALVAMVLALVFSFPLGAWAAFKENTAVDASVTLISSIGLAIPNFLLGPLLIIFFAVQLSWFPVSGTGGIEFIVLPAVTLAASMSAFLTRIIKTSISTELKKPYVLLARAKGLSEFQVFKNHLLKNSMGPIVTTIGLQLGALLTGTVITETVFSWQGIGSLLVTAIQRRDYPMIQGIIVFITFVYLVLSFLVDISYYIIDPRIRYDNEQT